MNTEDRIKLRNELYNELKSIKVINKRNQLQQLKLISINNIKLKEKIELYILQFKSKDEAFYCITHHDDPTNHLCSICKKQTMFYCNPNNNKRKFYCKTCGNKKCIEKLANSIDAKIKSRKTCKEHFGVENVSQSLEIKEKKRKTYEKHFGIKQKNIRLTPEQILEKSRETCRKNRGVDYPTQCPEIVKKVQHTNKEKYGTKYAHQQHIYHYNIWENDENFIQFIKSEYIEKKSFITLNDIMFYFNITLRTAKRRITKLNLLDYFYIQQSNLELDFESFLNENNIQFKKNDKTILCDKMNNRKEIDFLCNNKIGFEINDIATHNSHIISNTIAYKDPQYHQQKSLLAQEKGIYLLHIWEWELRNDNEWNKLSKWILNLLSDNKIIVDARECFIGEICKDIEKNFINEYHLQEYIKSDICYGLYYNKELIQVMSFKYDNNKWELLRLCTKYGYNIIDGTKTLLKRFIEDNNPSSIIHYCNLDKFNGKVYEELGFSLLKYIDPKIIWCNKNMKHFSENEISDINGYIPIYDCGKSVYIMNL